MLRSRSMSFYELRSLLILVLVSEFASTYLQASSTTQLFVHDDYLHLESRILAPLYLKWPGIEIFRTQGLPLFTRGSHRSRVSRVFGLFGTSLKEVSWISCCAVQKFACESYVVVLLLRSSGLSFSHDTQGGSHSYDVVFARVAV